MTLGDSAHSAARTLLTCGALALSLAASAAIAQTPAPAGSRVGKASKPATAAEKPPKSAARKRARTAVAAAGATAAAAAAASALVPADDAQLQALGLTHLGDHACEFKRRIQVLAHPTQPGYVQFNVDRRWITAKPVLSHTGALRLEDVRGQFLLLQIAFKSMLMDVKSGQRIADECLHDRHHEARAAAAAAPPQPGLGIAAPRE